MELDTHWYITAFLLFLGCSVQTAIGFGMAVVAAPILVIIKPQWVPYVLTFTALFLSISNAWQQRQHILWTSLWSPMLTRIPGTVAGTWLLLIMPVLWLQLAVASMVIVTVIVSLWLKPFQPNTTNLGIAGFISGVTGTTTSIGGPPIALVLQHSAGATARANLSMYFVYSCILSIIGYLSTGLMSWQLFYTSLSFLPFAALGFLCGIKIQRFVDNRFRPVLLGICTLSALMAIINALASA